jgi:hypothetical protein
MVDDVDGLGHPLLPAVGADVLIDLLGELDEGRSGELVFGVAAAHTGNGRHFGD